MISVVYKYITQFIIRRKKTMHLHRWCTPAYNKKCDINRKIDLANNDNSF